MRTKILLLLISLVGFVSIQGCYDTFNCETGRGPVVIEEIQVDTVTDITFAEAGSVYIVQDTVQRITIESHQNLINLVNTSVRNGVWDIRFRQCVRNYEKFNVYISVVDMNSVILTGSGNIMSEGPIESENFFVSLGGSGNIDLEVYSDIINADLPGSGNISLFGETDSETLFLSGSGNIRTFNMESNISEVTISGSGNCEVFVKEELDVLISGSGSVRYKGNPPIVNTRITGSGSVSPVN